MSSDSFLPDPSTAVAAASAQPILPPGHPPLPKPKPLDTYTLESLASTASDASSSRRLIALKGCIFDVSEDARFQSNGRWAAGVGRDITRSLAFEPIAAAASSSSSSSSDSISSFVSHLYSSFAGSTALRGLSFDQLRTLETWYKHFEAKYTLVGRLLTPHELEQSTSADASATLFVPGESDLPPMPSDVFGSFLPLVEATTAAGSSDVVPKSLHSLIDSSDDESICCSFLSTLPVGSVLLEGRCHRSGMVPIHRAIENTWPKLLKLLIEKGAKTDVPCELYDNDSPLQLAQRFHFNEAVEMLQSLNTPSSSSAAPSAADLQTPTTDMFTCKKCNGRKCSYYQMQTRTADEPMTIFISCLVDGCGNRWREP